VAGRLSLEEVRSRTEVVLAARYADEADAALAELPETRGLPEAAVPADPAGKASPPAAAAHRRGGIFARRGHAEHDEPSPGWVRTGERFRDPSSGAIMRVWTDPADGSRHYVPDDDPAS
jgi:hypothetical protein